MANHLRIIKKDRIKKTKTYCPLLKKGVIRKVNYTRLDPLVKFGLKNIARIENKSMSWVVEEVLIDYFKIRHSLRKYQ